MGEQGRDSFISDSTMLFEAPAANDNDGDGEFNGGRVIVQKSSAVPRHGTVIVCRMYNFRSDCGKKTYEQTYTSSTFIFM